MPTTAASRRPSARQTALAMVLAILILVLAGMLNYDGRFGPLLCWPHDYEPERAHRILTRQTALPAYENFRILCHQADARTVRSQITPEIVWRATVESVSGEQVRFDLVEPYVYHCRLLAIDWPRAWQAWLQHELTPQPDFARIPVRSVAPRFLFQRLLGGKLDVNPPTHVIMRRVAGEWRFAGFEPADSREPRYDLSLPEP